MNTMPRIAIGYLIVLVASLTAAASAQSQGRVERSPNRQEPCDPHKAYQFENDYRPSKWKDPKRSEWLLNDVEKNHFLPRTEMLMQSTRGMGIGHDLNYVLHWWPNHHRALLTLVRLGEREGTDAPAGTKFTIGCYFERAVRFAPDDTVLRGLYARYLAQRGERAQALFQLELLKDHAGDNPLSQQNAGLIYFEMQEFAKALEQAYVVEDLGLPQTNVLRQQLEAAGKWHPKPAPPSGSSKEADDAGTPAPPTTAN